MVKLLGKPQLKVNLLRDMKGNEKDFQFVSTEEEIGRGGFAVGWAQPLVTEDTEKVRELSATFSLPLTCRTGLHQPYIPETLGRSGARESYPWWRIGMGDVSTSWTPQAPCGILAPGLGPQVQQAVSEVTMGLEHLMGKERQGELGEVRLERRRLRVSPHVCRHLMGDMERTGQALLQLPRDRGWSWQCPKVLAASVSCAALGCFCGILGSPEQVPPYKGAAIQMVFVPWDRGAGEALYNVLDALIKSSNCRDCALFRGQQERGTLRESLAELPNPFL